MKPPEILGMLEEAAGTRMYESKKEAALRTLDKKQVKVEEINKVFGRSSSNVQHACGIDQPVSAASLGQERNVYAMQT